MSPTCNCPSWKTPSSHLEPALEGLSARAQAVNSQPRAPQTPPSNSSSSPRRRRPCRQRSINSSSSSVGISKRGPREACGVIRSRLGLARCWYAMGRRSSAQGKQGRTVGEGRRRKKRCRMINRRYSSIAKCSVAESV